MYAYGWILVSFEVCLDLMNLDDNCNALKKLQHVQFKIHISGGRRPKILKFYEQKIDISSFPMQ